jgi:gas vesicle protein GvpL/GvpF
VAASPMREDARGWYLYGVVAADAEAPAGAPSVDSANQVVSVPGGRVAALASRVSLVEFDEETLPQRLADAEWLEEKIRAHEQLLEAALASTTVVPCRFCTVYRSEEDLRAFLAEHSDDLREALSRLEGRVELGVKALVDPKRFSAELEAAAQATSGRAYMQARREEQRLGAELMRFQGELAGNLHERLLRVADDGVTLDLQSREISGRDEEMLFNAAYLIGDRAPFEEELAQAALEAREHGVELELTGPWPPYNFVPAELSRS